MTTTSSLLNEIFKFQQEQYPDVDPGDLAIDCQDDMTLCVVTQENWRQEDYTPIAGATIEEALTNYFYALQWGHVKRYPPEIHDHLLTIFEMEAAVITCDRQRFEEAVANLRKRI